jgi:hypothetical protein
MSRATRVTRREITWPAALRQENLWPALLRATGFASILKGYLEKEVVFLLLESSQYSCEVRNPLIDRAEYIEKVHPLPDALIGYGTSSRADLTNLMT